MNAVLNKVGLVVVRNKPDDGSLSQGNGHTKITWPQYYMDEEHRPQSVSQMSTPAHFDRSILMLCELSRKVHRSKDK